MLNVGTLAVSWGDDHGFFVKRVDLAWRLQLGRLSLQYIRVESADLVTAWADEARIATRSGANG